MARADISRHSRTDRKKEDSRKKYVAIGLFGFRVMVIGILNTTRAHKESHGKSKLLLQQEIQTGE